MDERLEKFLSSDISLVNDAPLFSAAADYCRKSTVRCHTPGHSSHGLFPLSYDLDLTEVSGLDTLFEANGAIAEAERRASGFFSSAATFFSAGGCTLCIQTMISLASRRAAEKHGAPVGIFGRNCHRSAVFASAMCGTDMRFIMPRGGRILPKELKKSLLDNPDAGFVYITSPDYFGRLSDIKALSAVCRVHDVPLLVDNAHGTHLILSDAALHPIRLGASMTACSAHKTLPVLTGGAFLNIADKAFVGQAKSAMAMFGSSSPSYPVMLSLDYARAWCEKYGAERFVSLCEAVKGLRLRAEKKGFTFEKEPCDPMRLTLCADDVGLSADELARHFMKCEIEPEYTGNRRVVLIISLMHTVQELERIENAILSVPSARCFSAKDESFEPGKRAMPVRQALMESHIETVPAENSTGRISAQVLCPCPPGIPVCVPGEYITRQNVNLFVAGNIKWVQVVQ